MAMYSISHWPHLGHETSFVYSKKRCRENKPFRRHSFIPSTHGIKRSISSPFWIRPDSRADATQLSGGSSVDQRQEGKRLSTENEMILNMIRGDNDDNEVMRRLKAVSRSGLMEQSDDQSTVLHAAVESGDIRAASLLIRAGVIDVDVPSGLDARTALFSAIKRNNTEMIQTLLDLGADNNYRPPDGVTPLLLATKCANLDTVRLILTHGTHRDILDPKTHMSPMFYAVARRDIDMIDALITAKATIGAENFQGLTALGLACKLNDTVIVRHLIQKGHPLFFGRLPEISPLHAAIRQKSTKLVEILLKAGFDVSEASVENKSPAEEALLQNSTSALKLILAYSSVIPLTSSGSSLLHLATSMGNLEAMKLLLEEGYEPDINSLDAAGDSCLFYAIRANRTDLVDYLISKGIDKDALDASDSSPVLAAAAHASENMVFHLLSRGLDGKSYTADGVGLLGFGVRKNSSRMVSKALSLGIWPDEPIGRREGSVLAYAVRKGYTQITKLLLEAGANPRKREPYHTVPKSADLYWEEEGERDAYNGEGMELCPIHHAAIGGHAECVKLLLDHGALTNEWGPEGKDALFYAVERNHTEAAKMLLSRGSTVKKTNIEGLTPLLIASAAGNTEVVQALIDKGAAVDARSVRGPSPLYIATVNKRHGPMEVLIRNGANIEFSDNHGYTPAAVAASRGDLDALRILIENGANLDLTYIRAPFKDVEIKKVQSSSTEEEEGGTKEDLAAGKEAFKRFSVHSSRGVGFTISDSEEEDGVDDFFETATEDDGYWVDDEKDNGKTISKRKNEQVEDSASMPAAPALKATPLIDAIWREKEDVIEFMLKSGAATPNFMPTGEENISPLHVAVRQDKPRICELLIKYGANKDFKGPNVKALSVMALAIRLGRMECVAVLLKAGATISQDIGVRKQGTLLSLIKARRVEAVRLLLKLGVNPNDPFLAANTTMPGKKLNSELGVSAVIMATDVLTNSTTKEETEASLEILQDLTSAGADCNARRPLDNVTALLLAIRRNHTIAVKHLLSAGADVNATRHDGSQSMHVACLEASKSIVELLLEAGVDVNAATSTGITPLFVAAQEGRGDIVLKLLEKGANPNTEGPSQATPLIMGIQAGSTEVVHHLIEFGSWMHREASDYSPLIIATQAGNYDVLEVMLQRGANANTMTREGITPLHIAVHKGDTELARILLRHGADPNAFKRGAGSALIHSAVRGCKGILEEFLKHGGDPNADHGVDDTPLYVAAEQGFDAAISLLAAFKADLDHPSTADASTALHVAAERGGVRAVQELLARGADPNIRNQKGCSPLLSACIKNKTDETLELIRAGAKLDIVAQNGATPLIVATQLDNEVIVNALLEAGSDVDFVNSDGYTPLLAAIRHNSLRSVTAILRANPNLNMRAADNIRPGKLAVICNRTAILKKMINHGLDPDEVDEDGTTLLSTAATASTPQLVKVLVESKANLDFKNGNGMSPLHASIRRNRFDVVRHLLEAGADPNTTDSMGFNSLHMAVLHNSHDLIELLVQHRADINHRAQDTGDGATPLFVAANDDLGRSVSKLLELGADPNIPNNQKLTPLGTAAWQGNTVIVRSLLEHNANVDQLNTNGASAVFLAIQRDNWGAMEALLDGGAQMDLPDFNGWTPLMWVAIRGNLEIAKELLERGADVNQKTSLGCTAVHCAAYHRQKEMIDLFTEHGADMSILDSQGRTPEEILYGPSETDGASASDVGNLAQEMQTTLQVDD